MLFCNVVAFHVSIVYYWKCADLESLQRGSAWLARGATEKSWKNLTFNLFFSLQMKRIILTKNIKNQECLTVFAVFAIFAVPDSPKISSFEILIYISIKSRFSVFFFAFFYFRPQKILFCGVISHLTAHRCVD